MNLRGKRLLLLGGTHNIADIRRYADDNGITLIASGNKPDHPLCRAAEEYYPADVRDVAALSALVREHNIHGIFAGGNEDIIPTVIQVCERTGLTFYASQEQWDITGNKRRFKDACRAAGVPVVPEYTLTDPTSREQLNAIRYPVVIKPIDGSGSRGVYLCHNEAELLAAYPEALKASRSQTLMVERFMTGFVIVFYITAINGEYHVASMCDKYTEPGRPMATVPQLHLYPSRHLRDCLDRYYPALCGMLRSLHIQNGVVGIQGFCEDGDITFTEMGYRLGGTSQQNFTKYLYNYSNMELLINHALTGRMTDEPCRENPFFPKECATLALISTGGTVARIEGLDIVRAMPGVICVENHYEPGDTILPADNLSILHFRVFLAAEDLPALKALVLAVQRTLHVYDAGGNSLLREDFDADRIGLQ